MRNRGLTSFDKQVQVLLLNIMGVMITAVELLLPVTRLGWDLVTEMLEVTLDHLREASSELTAVGRPPHTATKRYEQHILQIEPLHHFNTI